MCTFGSVPATCLLEEAIFVKSQKCPYHVTFHLDFDLEQAGLGTIMCKFGSDPTKLPARRSDFRKIRNVPVSREL